jgi:hypothetical protein
MPKPSGADILTLRRDPLGPRLEQELGFALELPDPLSRELKLSGELGERWGIPTVEAVAPHHDVPCLLRQTLDDLPEPRNLQLRNLGTYRHERHRSV